VASFLAGLASWIAGEALIAPFADTAAFTPASISSRVKAGEGTLLTAVGVDAAAVPGLPPAPPALAAPAYGVEGGALHTGAGDANAAANVDDGT
jgi:hypothetical protein